MRTDLPIEGCLEAAEELVGTEWEQEKQEDEITVSTVCIKTSEGEKRLQRPKGLYVTLECLFFSFFVTSEVTFALRYPLLKITFCNSSHP